MACRWRTSAPPEPAAPNVNGAKGGFDGPRLAFSLGANDQLADAAAYKDLVIAWRSNASMASATPSIRLVPRNLWRGIAGSPAMAGAGTSNGAPVRLSAVGSVVAGVENARVAATYDGRPKLSCSTSSGNSGANIVETVEAVKQELPRLRRAMPSGIRLTISERQDGDGIWASVADVQFTLLLSAWALVVGVIFVFPAVVARDHHTGV